MTPPAARAQSSAARLQGVITDATGALVPGAAVKVTDLNTNRVLQTVSGASTGAWAFPALPPGNYELEINKQGFKAVRQKVTLEVAQVANVNFALETGAVTEELLVTAEAAVVDSASSDMGLTVRERQIVDLPLNGRNFTQLALLVPGVSRGATANIATGSGNNAETFRYGTSGGAALSVNGARPQANNFMLDGVDNNESLVNTIVFFPPAEAIQEFRVQTSIASAEFGRAGGGIVNTATRSGGNDVHGSAFEFLRNSELDARPTFAASRVAFRRNQFGGTLGAPIVKDKLFVFGDYQGFRQSTPVGTDFASVPTALMRQGNFSELLNPALSGLSQPIAITNLQTGQPFAGNIIPTSRINPVSANVASIYPLPNAPGNFNNYTIAVPRAVDDDGFNVRMDHQFSQKDSFFARYSYETFRLSAPQGQANCCLPTPSSALAKFDLGPYVAGLQVTQLTTQGMAVNETHVFSPSLVNEFRGGFARTNPFTVQSDLGHNAATSLGIQGVNISSLASGIPGINVTDFTGLSGGPSFLPANPRETHWQLEDGVSWTKARHQMKFGYRYIRVMTSPYTGPPGGGPRGDMTFGKNFTNDPVTNTQGTGLASLLLGYISGGNGRSILLTPYYTTNQENAMYFQDDWKVTPRLTLNLGIRYDIYVPDVEIRNRLVNFDFTHLTLAYAGQSGISNTAGKQTRWGDLGPRVGLAWDVAGNGKTVVRSGFAQTFFPELPSGSNMLGEQVPYVVSQTPFGNIPTNPTDWTTIPQIQNPYPAISTTQPLTTAQLNASGVGIIGHGFQNQTPSMMTWSIDVQRQISASMMAEVAYAGSHSIHLDYGWNPNETQPGPGTQPSRRLLQPLSNISSFTIFDFRNSSFYNGLSAKFEKRFSSGLQFMASYTFSKNLDYGGSAASGGGAVGNPQTVTNLTAGRGPSGFDVKHRFVANYLYELPFGKGQKWVKSGPLAYVVGGWSLSGITTLSGGRPFSLSLNTGVNNGAPSWPNRTCNGTLSNPDRAHWFDQTCFAAPPPNTYGNVGRGVIYGPGQVNFDMSFVKNNRFTERLNVQFRLDTFNLSNTPFFGFPNAAIGSPTVGQITTTNGDNRDLQFALKFEF
jgi:outer membrane receptor protein involved in Fe transport